MPVHSFYLGSVRISGEEAKAFTRKIKHGRGNKAATETAKAGKHLSDTLLSKGVVKLSLKGTLPSK